MLAEELLHEVILVNDAQLPIPNRQPGANRGDDRLGYRLIRGRLRETLQEFLFRLFE
jgi:hypothetical protein